ncbi:hypothetical protein LUW77_04830 [Streptomyces radiopugnans]|nr:hypothetical protein LUW77_04830 [Streptomyces radiopugnans]
MTPLLLATGISVTGDGAFLAAAPLLAASLTRDPLAVSAVTAAFYLPWLIVPACKPGHWSTAGRADW